MTDLLTSANPAGSTDSLDDLLCRVKLGDRQAFRALYDASSPVVFGICLRILGDRQDAEDALQESFVKVWHHCDRFDPARGGAKTWMSTIARRTAIDLLRVRKPVRSVTDAEQPVARDSGPSQTAEHASDLQRLMFCLDQLGPEQSSALRSAYLDGDRYQDISSRLNMPLNTVRTWLRRGLIALRECMT